MSRTTTLAALAIVVADASGGRWDARGINAALDRVPADRPIGQTAAAALYAAIVRTDQQSPACIPLDGEHWRAYDHMIGRAQGPITPVPPTRLRCPDHGEHDGATCPDCTRLAAPHERVAGYLAAAREAIRAARPDHRPDTEEAQSVAS